MSIEDMIAEATAPVTPEAQPQTVATEQPEGTQETEVAETNEAPEAEKPKVLTPAEELEKLRKAKARDDRRIGKLTAQKYQYLKELEELKKTTSTTPAQASTDLSVAKTGIPTKLKPDSFSTYADYMEARTEEIADYKISRKLSEYEGKNQETLQSQRIADWEAQRSEVVDKMADGFAKEHPEINDMYEEYADTIREFPVELKHALLAAENPPLAFYNLAKEGRLEELASMSPVDARVEIRLAQMKQPEKPRTKAPTPLSTSRGSVASGKNPKDFTPEEAQKFLSQRE